MRPGHPLGAQPHRHRLKDFMQTVSTCDALYQRNDAALRAQVHDLGELLAAFDLCEIEDPHLKAVRDRAFGRDFAPDAELLQVYRAERQLQQEALLNGLDEEPTQQHSATSDRGKANEIPRHGESSSKVATALDLLSRCDTESLQLRVDVLERDVSNLHLRHNLLLQMAPRLKSPVVGAGAGQPVNVDCPLPSTGDDIVETNTQEAEEHAISEKYSEDTTKTIQEQQQRILELEKALAMESTRNAAMEQLNRRYEEVEKILKEFSQHR